MSGMLYILDDQGSPIEADAETWASRFSNNRVLARDVIGDLLVSTVFLGINHNYGSGPPILWETMVLMNSGSDDLLTYYQDRYATREEALAGHQRAVQLASAKAITEAPKAITDKSDDSDTQEGDFIR